LGIDPNVTVTGTVQYGLNADSPDFYGTHTVYQSGQSGASTKRIETAHDGTHGTIESFNGDIRLKQGSNVGVEVQGFATILRSTYLGSTAFGQNGLVPGVLGNGSWTLASIPLTPSQITANQDNYNCGVAQIVRQSADAQRSITGFAISQVSGQWMRFVVVGSFAICLKHDVTSTAANRIYCPGEIDLWLAPNDWADLEYDGTTQRWRVVATSPRRQTFGTSTEGATITLDVSVYSRQQLNAALAGNRTMAVSNAYVGQSIQVLVQQDATGGRTLSWTGTGFTTVTWAEGQDGNPEAVANKYTHFTLQQISSGVWHGFKSEMS
jgi:hypothetical protein